MSNKTLMSVVGDIVQFIRIRLLFDYQNRSKQGTPKEIS